MSLFADERDPLADKWLWGPRWERASGRLRSWLWGCMEGETERQREREREREREERPLSAEGIGPITGPRLVWFFIYHKIRPVLAKRNGFRDRG